MKSLNCARKTYRNWARHTKSGSYFCESNIDEATEAAVINPSRKALQKHNKAFKESIMQKETDNETNHEASESSGRNRAENENNSGRKNVGRGLGRGGGKGSKS